MSVATRKNLNTLSDTELCNLTQSTYAHNSYFQQQFGADSVEINCEHSATAFRHQIERILQEKNIISSVPPLESLHEHVTAELKAYNFNDGVNKISTYFYDTDSQFMDVYHDFIVFLRKNFLKEPFWFQATPTIRIHCPNGENNHHYPRYHTDIGYGHPPEEINLWIPLTAVMGGHGFRVMSVANSKQILNRYAYRFASFIEDAINNKPFSAQCDQLSHAVTTDFGKFIAFDSRSIHTGEPLKDHTRISMDVRIIPVSRYDNMDVEYQGAGRRKILFTPGHAYNPHDSDYFLQQKGN